MELLGVDPIDIHLKVLSLIGNGHLLGYILKIEYMLRKSRLLLQRDLVLKMVDKRKQK
jgi:hypothetical protein